jgi:hypothetical protein
VPRLRLPLGRRQVIYNLIIGGPGVIAATAAGIVTLGDPVVTGAVGIGGLAWALAVQARRDSPRERAAERESAKLREAVAEANRKFNSPQRVINDERIWKQQQQWRRRGGRDRRYGE